MRQSACFASLLLAALAGSAHAQVGGLYRSAILPGTAEGGTAGLLLLQGQRYQGSSETRTLLLPSLDYKWSNGFFAGTGNGIGLDFSNTRQLHYGVRMTLDNGRKEKRSAALRGLGDIELRPELGVFATYSLSPQISVGSALRYGAGNDRDGLVLDVGASYSLPVAERFRLGLSLTGSWANEAYQREYFGIDLLQAARSGYAVYRPGAGWRDARLSLSATYSLTPSWALTGLLARGTLLGDAKDSPIVQQRHSNSGGLALSYRF